MSKLELSSESQISKPEDVSPPREEPVATPGFILTSDVSEQEQAAKQHQASPHKRDTRVQFICDQLNRRLIECRDGSSISSKEMAVHLRFLKINGPLSADIIRSTGIYKVAKTILQNDIDYTPPRNRLFDFDPEQRFSVLAAHWNATPAADDDLQAALQETAAWNEICGVLDKSLADCQVGMSILNRED